MIKLNHFTLTLAISFWIYYFIFSINLAFTFLLSLITAMLSSLPDIDIKIIKQINSYNRKTLYLLYPITFLLKLIFKHRTITHSIWLPLFLLLLDIIFNFNNIIIDYSLRVFYIAIFLHIIEDATTKKGVKIFFPIPFNLRLFVFSTSSKINFLLIQLISYSIIFMFFLNI
ncbi:MAG: metal-dependent hydrolase [Nanoarchaeota archaeon]